VARRSATFLIATVATAGVAAGVATPGAGARPATAAATSPLLWATVNVCDTAEHPDTIGIRGSMPGNGVRAQQMYMRFQLQYLATTDGRWHNIGPSADSGFTNVGSAKYRQRQYGRNFTVQPPATGAYRLRGAVTFEWRKGTEVVRRARMRTTGGHGNTAGADPRGFSAAACSIKK
jgi:hypothetical protein